MKVFLLILLGTSMGQIEWKDEYMIKYKSGWRCNRYLSENRYSFCSKENPLRVKFYDCTKDNQVCKDIK